MIGKRMEEALNGQVNAELYSAYLYLSMDAYFESLNLAGFANWMHVQTQGKSPLDVFEATLTHEQKVTGLINELVNLAIEEKDHATNSFLQWFVNEQVEEESSADEILAKLKLIEASPQALYMLDQEMAQRVFTPPPVAEAGA